MNLTIGSKTIEIVSCEQRRDNKKGFFLDIVAPVANVSMDELRSLLKDNKEDIVVAKEDGTVNTYTGFGLLGVLSCEENMIHVAQYANSEIEAQLSVAQNKIVEQDAVIATLQAENSLLLEELLTTQLALCELYEQNLPDEPVYVEEVQ